jgi:hypothetical protein
MTPPVVRLRTLGVPGASSPKLDYDLRSTSPRARERPDRVRDGAGWRTSVKMIEAQYGTLIDTAHDAILGRLEDVGG